MEKAVSLRSRTKQGKDGNKGKVGTREMEKTKREQEKKNQDKNVIHTVQ
jgi:hypothetical protein